MRATLLIASVAIIPQLASAQSNLTAGLFTEARHLPLVSQALSVEIVASEATVHLVQVFHNDGPDVGQADYRLHLPAEASVVGFGFWQNGRYLAASLEEKSRARAAHRRAAREGRATGLLEQEERVHSFGVYPLAANEQKQVEVTLRLPVAREMGRSHLRLPLGEFLGQPKVNTNVWVEVETEDPLEEIGVDGESRKVEVTEVSRHQRWAQLAFSAEESVELWWVENAPPLQIRADIVALPDEPHPHRRGLQLRIALSDAGEWSATYRSVDLLVDASFSMRRKQSALSTLLGRISDQASTPITLHAVTEEVTALDGVPLDEALATLLSGELGHSSDWAALENAVTRLGCSAERRCVVITDPQINGLTRGTLEGATVLFLGDANELSTFAGVLGQEARTFQVESDSRARLLAMADETVLPVLDVVTLVQGDQEIELIGYQHRRVAEGGMLRLFGTIDSAEPITVMSRVAGNEITHHLVPQRLGPTTRAGQGVRRGVYGQVLVQMMDQYRDTLDPNLRDQIVALSLREEIPTPFTSLQVDDPELSMYAIKPGDPVLTVRDEPNLRAVTAWYPYGETRRLARDPTSGDYSDRFLVPRGWRDRLYRIDVFKHFTGGEVRRNHVWYHLDQRAPGVALHWDRGRNLLQVRPSDETLGIGAVAVHLDDGTVRTLSPVEDTWLVPIEELTGTFTVVVRDYAGNRSAFLCELNDAELLVRADPKRNLAHTRTLPRELLPTSILGGGEHGYALHRQGRSIELTRPGKSTLRFQAPLRSLWLTAYTALGSGEHLIGTQGGDLIRLSCNSRARCHAEGVEHSFAHHPITGLESLGPGRVLVGVLGEGLFEVAGTELDESRIRVGSAYITDMVKHGQEIFIATAYNGLWRLAGNRALRTRFPHDHVSQLRSGDQLTVQSGYGEWSREARDRYRQVHSNVDSIPTGSPDIMGAVHFEDMILLAGYDGGLYRLVDGSMDSVLLDLLPAEKRINAIAVYDGAIWLGTQGGLLRVEPGCCAVGIERLLSPEVHDLDLGDGGLAIATSRGLFVSDGSEVVRVDQQKGIGSHSFMAVAWSGDLLFAGGMEGLFWISSSEAGQVGESSGFDAGWVTALHDDSDRLLVGTYADGVYSIRVGEHLQAEAVPGLEHQWVPYHSIRRIGDSIWVGGLGMPPVRWSGSDMVAVDVPVRDVNDFLATEDGVLLSTSHGPVRLDLGETLMARK